MAARQTNWIQEIKDEIYLNLEQSEFVRETVADDNAWVKQKSQDIARALKKAPEGKAVPPWAAPLELHWMVAHPR